jgi:hypothetical protein
MNKIQKRFVLFLIGCIGMRSLFTYIAKISSQRTLKYMGYIASIPAIGFIYLFLSGSRETGPEVMGDKIWWNPLRPIHSFLYIMFSYHAIFGYRNIAWLFLLADVLIGFVSFLVFHYISGNFKYLMK